MRDKLFTQDELSKVRKAQTLFAPVDDDYLQSCKSASLRLFPRKSFDSLTADEFNRVRDYVATSYNNSNENFYKRYVLKKK